MHIQSEHALDEVLDVANRPRAPGETGRVVATNLHNFATPTIRMDPGDLATVGAPCPCGRGLPVLARIDGRARDLMTLPDGHRILPSFDETRITAAALTEAERTALAQAFNDGFGRRFDISFRAVDLIARAPGGKIRRWVTD